MSTLEEAIVYVETVAKANESLISNYETDRIRAEIHRQLAEWLKTLKSAKFEYDEAWRIITHPTPDVTSYDKDRAQVILDTFRDSLGRLEC